MVGATVLGAALLIFKIITLFWLEIVVALLFAVFWMFQTVEQSATADLPETPQPSASEPATPQPAG